MTDDYQRRSYGEISVGTGEKPGIVVVDFQLGFTDPQYPLGGAPLVMRARAHRDRMGCVNAARTSNPPRCGRPERQIFGLSPRRRTGACKCRFGGRLWISG